MLLTQCACALAKPVAGHIREAVAQLRWHHRGRMGLLRRAWACAAGGEGRAAKRRRQVRGEQPRGRVQEPQPGGMAAATARAAQILAAKGRGAGAAAGGGDELADHAAVRAGAPRAWVLGAQKGMLLDKTRVLHLPVHA